MKYLLSLVVFISVLCTSLSAVEYGYISTNNTSPNPHYLVLEEGDFVELFLCTTNNTVEALYIFSPQVDINDVSQFP